MKSIFSDEQLGKMHLIRNHESRDPEMTFQDHSIKGGNYGRVIETGYKVTVHAATAGEGWYVAVKHEYDFRNGEWHLKNCEVASDISLRNWLSLLHML